MSGWIASLHPAIAHVVMHAEPILRQYGYAGMFVCNFFEGLGIPLPGQTLLIAGSVLAAKGEFRIGLVLATTFFATVAGSCIGYWVGRRGGRALLLRLRFPPGKLAHVEGFFVSRGVLVVIGARFVDGFRQTVPIIAGSSRMPWWSFLGATVVGSLAWLSLWGGAMYLLSRDARGLLAHLHDLTRYGWWVAVPLLALALSWLLVREPRQ